MNAGHPLDQKIRAANENIDSVSNRIAERAPQVGRPIPISRVRAWLAMWIVGAFLFYILVLGVLILYGAEAGKVATLSDTLKTYLWPTVMLVLGFYFGSKTT
jgi:hypothetical protein